MKSKILLALFLILRCVNLMGEVPNSISLTGGSFFVRLPDENDDSDYSLFEISESDTRLNWLRLVSNKTNFVEDDVSNSQLDIYVPSIRVSIREGEKTKKSSRFYNYKLERSIQFAINNQYEWYDFDYKKSSGLMQIDNGNGLYTATETLNSHNFTIPLNELIEEITKKDPNAYRNNKLTIYIRYGIKFEGEFKENRGESRYSKVYRLHSPERRIITINIYKCSIKDYKIEGDKIATIGDDQYAVLAGVKNGAFKLSSENVHHSEGKITEEVLCYKNDEFLTSAQVTNTLYDSFNSEGMQYTFKKKISYPNADNIFCESKPVTLKVFPMPTLDKIAEGDSIILCPMSRPSNFAENTHTLVANEINIEGYEKYKEIYQPEYQWVYWSDKNSYPQKIGTIKNDAFTISTPTYMFDLDESTETKKDINLDFPIYNLKDDLTYYFKQKVVLKGFGNEVIENKNDKASTYVVKLSRRLDADKLVLGISEEEVCEGTFLEDVKFSAKYNDDKQYYINNTLQYQSKILNNNGDEEWSESYKDSFTFNQNYYPISASKYFEVTVTDGCQNTIQKEDSISVKALPKLFLSAVQPGNDNTEVKADDNEGCVVVYGVKGKQCEIVIKEDDKSSHNYFYSEDSADIENLKVFPPTGYELSMTSNDTIFIYKQPKNGKTLCYSKPIEVRFYALDNITGNKFINLDTIYVCADNRVPEIKAEQHISRANISSGVISYVWEFSTSGGTMFTSMTNVNQDGDRIEFTNPSYDGSWNMIIQQGEKVYIRRKAIATLGDVVLATNYSDTLLVTTYSALNMELQVDHVSDGTVSKCYLDTVKFSSSIDSTLLTEIELMNKFYKNQKSDLKNYNYYDKDINANYEQLFENSFSVNSPRAFVSKKTRYQVYAGVDFCNERNYSQNVVTVETYDELKPTIAVSDCKIVGQEVTITASMNGADCNIIQGDSVYGKSATFVLETKQNYPYTVEVTHKTTNCKTKIQKSISIEEIETKILPTIIGINGSNADTLVCAGQAFTINSDSEEEYKSYSWSVNGQVISEKVEKRLNYTFPQAGKSYLVKRTNNYYKNNSFCYSVEDSIRIKTYEPLGVPAISSYDSSLCNGYSVEISAAPNLIGGGSGDYKVTLFEGNDDAGQEYVNILRKGDIAIFEPKHLTSTTDYYIKITDNTCKNDLYSAKSKLLTINVEKDLEFTIDVNDFISVEDFKDSLFTLTIKCPEVAMGETLIYECFGKRGEILYNGNAFTIETHQKDFEKNNNSMELSITRKGSVVNTCELTKSISIVLNEGFDGRPALSCNEEELDTIEVCSNQEVRFEVTNVDNVRFADESIMNLTDVTWQLWRGDVPVATLTTPKFEGIKIPKGTHSYSVLFRGTDKSGRVRKLFSKPIVMIGRGQINMGSIAFVQYTNNTFVEFCENSAASVEMKSDFNDPKVDLQWKYSEDYVDWIDVPETWNNGNPTTTGVINVKLSELQGKKHYFRIYGKDSCGTESWSNGALTVDFKKKVAVPDVKLASTSDQLIEIGADMPTNLLFRRDYFHTDPYEFIGRESTPEGSLQKVDFSTHDPLQLGENSVKVVRFDSARVSKESCPSDTIEFTFKIFEKLSSPNLTNSLLLDTVLLCPNNEKIVYLDLNGMVGGDSSTYKTVWQYQDAVGNWWRIEEGDNDGLFTAKIENIVKNWKEYSQKVQIEGLKRTTDFRAHFDCEGGYPGSSQTSKTTTIEVYNSIKDGGIRPQNYTICYNTNIDSLQGYSAEQGSGKYIYTWYKSTDMLSWEEINRMDDYNPSFYPSSTTGASENLSVTTYYKRKVTDKVCKEEVESETTVAVNVLEEFLIEEKDIHYDKIVSKDQSVMLVGRTDFSGFSSTPNSNKPQYVWWKDQTTVIDSSAQYGQIYTEPLSFVDGDYEVKTFYVSGIRETRGISCSSANKLPFDITVFNQTGGRIFFADKEENEMNYIICSGEDSIQIYSEGNAPNAKYEWFYFIKGSANPINNKMYKPQSDIFITTKDIRLDTTSITRDLINSNGTRKSICVYRRSRVEIGGELTDLYSDTLTISVIPTLSSVKNLINIDLAGEINADKNFYCLGEEPQSIDGTRYPNSAGVIDGWDNYKDIMGPWMYNDTIKGGFMTYFEYQKNSGEWIKTEEYDYSQGYNYAKTFNAPITTIGLDGSYTVRRVLTDGCTNVYSNYESLVLFDDIPIVDSVKVTAVTPELKQANSRDQISTGFEIGDSLIFFLKETNKRVTFFMDPECTDTLSLSPTSRGGSLLLSDSVAELKSGEGAYIYMQAKDGEGCFGETVSVPFEYGTTSNGGEIMIDEAKICHNGEFGDIVSIYEASGTYISPKYKEMEWTYRWQYKRNEHSRIWSDIDGETGLTLSSEKINEVANVMPTSPLYIRRLATNDKGRERTSNELLLTHYEPLQPGVLSMRKGKNTFCSDEELDYVVSTSAQGGNVLGNYYTKFKYRVNGGEWDTLLVRDSLYLGLIDIGELTENKVVEIKCIYKDECEEVESEGFEVILYRENILPRFSQLSDSCNASVVKLQVYAEEYEKTYSWSAWYTDPEDSTATEQLAWSNPGESCTIIRNLFPTTKFSVESKDSETGCVSKRLYFYVDSLPTLSQAPLQAPIAICSGSDLEIRGGELSGGNGDKTYQWQISPEGSDIYTDLVGTTEPDLYLESKYIKVNSYLRRIVNDLCESDTSEAVYVSVRQAVPVQASDLILSDYKCENSTYSVKLSAKTDSLALSEYWTFGTDTFRVNEKEYQIEGFIGDSLSYSFAHYLTDTNNITCKSEVIPVMVHNRAKVDVELNTITTDNLTPCNESYITISGTEQKDPYITYTWYINGEELLGKNSPTLQFRANGDMRIVRVVSNGCEKDSSNALVLVGQQVFAYDYENELSLEVVSNSLDSSVVINILGSKNFNESYYFRGDGILPVVESNSTKLPYKYTSYKDSIIEIYAIKDYCVKPYRLYPIIGGVISFNGATELCGGDEVPRIVSTEFEDSRSYNYQWQYKNEYTPDYINIDGATSKSYLPDAIDVGTTYRRVTTSGIYKSITNELTLHIRPLPSIVRGIHPNLSVDTLAEIGLAYDSTNFYYEWISSVDMYLQAEATSYDSLKWQKSYNSREWETISDLDSVLVSDTTETVYYRLMAESGCGQAISKVATLKRREVSFITDEELSSRFYDYKKAYCIGSATYRELTITADTSYRYKVKAEYGKLGNADKLVIAHNLLSNQVTDTILLAPDPLDPHKAEGPLHLFMYEYYGDNKASSLQDNLTLHITRIDPKTGLTVSRSIEIPTINLGATFAMSVEGGEEILAGEKKSVMIEQGSRVEFRPIVVTNSSNPLTYKWSLQEPLNKEYYKIYGGREGLDGLTSELENPSCYYYNGGRYPMKLVVTDGECTSEIRDTSLYLPEESVRSRYNKSFALEGSLDYVEVIESEYVDVNPRLITDHVIVSSTNPTNVHSVKLVDELSREVWNGSFCGSLKIQTENLISGVYFIIVDETKIYKLIKK